MQEITPNERSTIENVLWTKYPRYAGAESNIRLIFSTILQRRHTVYPLEILEVVKKIQSQLCDVLAQEVQEMERQTGFSACESNRRVLETYADTAPLNADRLIFLAEQLGDGVLATSPRRAQILQARQRDVRNAETQAASNQERSELIQAACARLVDEQGRPHLWLGTQHESPQAALKRRTAEIRSMTLEQLRAARDRRQQSEEMKSLPLDELRRRANDEFKQQHADTIQQSGQYRTLPEFYSPVGSDEQICWSVGLFRRLASPEKARLLRIYGNEQLTQAFSKRGQ